MVCLKRFLLLLAFASLAFAYSDAPQVTRLAYGVRDAVNAHFGVNPGMTMLPQEYTNTTYSGLLIISANDNFHAYVNVLKSDGDLDGDATVNNLTVRYKKFQYGAMTTTKADFFCRPNPALSQPEYQVYFESETLRDFSGLMQSATQACLDMQQWAAQQPTPVPTSTPQLFPQVSPSPSPVVALTRCETDSDCVKGGCSSQLCVLRGTEAVTTCEWADYYSCYQNATCGCVSGKCSWDAGALSCAAAMQTATPTSEPTIAPTLPPATVTPTPVPQAVPLTDSVTIIVGAVIIFAAAYYAYTQLAGRKKKR
ncbi:MAG: eight-cysteine-cluster domain-containing protein [Candidatus Micrarchaeota archaeon]